MKKPNPHKTAGTWHAPTGAKTPVAVMRGDKSRLRTNAAPPGSKRKG